MVNRYYKNEFTEIQWKKLVDMAIYLHCVITYSIYGNVAEIDSTAIETRLLENEGFSANDSQKRCKWAEYIHGQILEAAHK